MLVLAGTCIIAAARNLATRDDGRTTLDPTNSCNDVVSPVAEMPPSSSSLLLLPLLAALATLVTVTMAVTMVVVVLAP